MILDGKVVSGAARGIVNPPVLRIGATDVRGFVYALLELVERVPTSAAWRRCRSDGGDRSSPANRVRSVARSFCSEVEDKAWFHDPDFWRGYLDNLIACRFNRFNLFLGIAYDFPRGVTDDYLHFPYPYLVTVPGYDVQVEKGPGGTRRL